MRTTIMSEGDGLDEKREESSLTAQSSDSSSRMPSSTDDNGDDDDDDLPIDRGYAWVIVFACAVCSMVCIGLQRANGILFVEFLVLFRQPASVTTLVLSVQSICCGVAAFLTQTVVLSLVSERQTMIMGGLCGGLGFSLSYFATSLYFLLFTQGLLVGVATAMITGPSYVIVNTYFRKRRSLATAINIMGGNLGAIVMSLLTHVLSAQYGVREAMLVLGAVYLNVMVAASFLRPLHQNRRRRQNTVKYDAVKLDDQTPLSMEDGFGGQDYETFCNSEKLIACPIQSTTTPKLAQVLETNTDIAGDKTDARENVEQSVRKDIKGLADEINRGKYCSELTIDGKVLSGSSQTFDQSNQGKKKTKTQEEHEEAEKEKEKERVKKEKEAGEEEEEEEEEKEGDKEKAKEDQTTQKKKKTKCTLFLEMLDFSLFRKPPFWIVLTSCPLGMVPAILIGIYLPAMAVEKGVSEQRAALLISLFAACGLFARLGFGWFADLNIIKRYILTAILMTLSCFTGLFTPLYSGFGHLVVFTVIYGLLGVVFFSLVPVLVVDLMGLHNLAKALGFVQFFNFIILAVAHPVIGLLRDVTGSYHASYYVMSGCGLLSAAILMLTPLAMRHEKY